MAGAPPGPFMSVLSISLRGVPSGWLGSVLIFPSKPTLRVQSLLSDYFRPARFTNVVGLQVLQHATAEHHRHERPEHCAQDLARL